MTSRAVVRLDADTKLFQAKIARAGAIMQKQSMVIKKSGATITHTLRTVSLAAAAVGVAAVTMAAKFDKGVTEIGTLVGGLTNNEIRAMKAELMALSEASGEALDKLTKARYDIVSAGFKDAASSAEMLRVSTQMAVGGVSNVATTADLLTTAINAYDLSAKDAARVSDVLFTTVQQGKTTMDALAGSMGRVIPIAAGAGIGLKEVGAVMATLTARGQSTEMAVTSTMAAINALMKPTTEAEQVIKALGFASGRAILEQHGLADSIVLMRDKAAALGIPLEALTNNIRAMQAIFPLAGGAAGMMAENLEAMHRSAGKMNTVYEQMSHTVSRRLMVVWRQFQNTLIQLGERLMPSVERAAIQISAAFRNAAPAIGGVVEKIGRLVEWAVQHGDIIGKIFVIATIGLVIGKLAVLTGAVFTLVKALGVLAIAAMKVMWPAILAAALVGLVVAFTQVEGGVQALKSAMIALVAVGVDVVRNWRVISNNIYNAWNALTLAILTLGVEFYNSWSKLWDETFKGLIGIIKIAQGDVQGGMNMIFSAVAEGIGEIVGNFKSAGEAAGKYFMENLDTSFDFSASAPFVQKAIDDALIFGRNVGEKVTEGIATAKEKISSILGLDGAPLPIGGVAAAAAPERARRVESMEIPVYGAALAMPEMPNLEAVTVPLQKVRAEFDKTAHYASASAGQMARAIMDGTMKGAEGMKMLGQIALEGLKGMAAEMVSDTVRGLMAGTANIGSFLMSTATSLGTLITSIGSAMTAVIGNVIAGVATAVVAVGTAIASMVAKIAVMATKALYAAGAQLLAFYSFLGPAAPLAAAGTLTAGVAAIKKVVGFEQGGIVQGQPIFAMAGTTDSIPAMLTPGEAVMTRRATQSAVEEYGENNFIRFLKSGDFQDLQPNVQRFEYYQSGGMVQGAQITRTESNVVTRESKAAPVVINFNPNINAMDSRDFEKYIRTDGRRAMIGLIRDIAEKRQN